MSERVLKLLTEPSEALLASLISPDSSPRKYKNRASVTKLDLATI